MESGTFNNVKKIGKYIIKTFKNDDILSNQIMREMHSRNVYDYVFDINDVGVKTGKLYGCYNIFNNNILIQEFIKGINFQEYLKNNNIDPKKKLELFKQFLIMYENTQKNNNLCLDWNLKNFILNKDDFYYIDFVPCLYKDKIETVTSSNLLQYKESYLNKEIQIAGILGYTITPFLNNLSINDAGIIYEKLKLLFYKITGINIDVNLINSKNHVYFYKLYQIEKYLNNSITYDELFKNITSYSMTKILRKEY